MLLSVVLTLGAMVVIKTSIPTTTWLNAFRFPFIAIWGAVLFGSALLTALTERKVHKRGTRLVSPAQFERLVQGDGIAIPTIERSRFLKHPRKRFLNIKAKDEQQHILIAGDTGTGKSALFHYIIRQLAIRDNDQLIVYDPKGEYWERHGIVERGDIWFHPSHPDCPYWDFFRDIQTNEDAILMARTLIPCREGQEHDFFIRSPRDVLTVMLQNARQRGATIADLLRWLSDPQEISKVLEGLPEAQHIPKDADPQRAGILATLSTIANTLRLLPQSPKGRRIFSCRDWVNRREGWLFVGSRGVRDQEVMQPIHSILFDTLIQSLLITRKNPPATWVFIDELGALKTLPFLEKAMTQARSYNTRFVLGFQNRYQVQHYYGQLSRSILSSPKTKIFLRTTEVDSAEWCAKSIGRPENQQKMRTESGQYANENRGSLSYRTDNRVDYLIIPNEIQIFPDRTGCFVYSDLAVKIEFDYPNLTQWNTLDQAPLLPAAAPAAVALLPHLVQQKIEENE